MRLPWSPFKMWFSSVVLPDLRGRKGRGLGSADRRRKQRHSPRVFSPSEDRPTGAVGTACARTHARETLSQDAPEEASQDRDGHALVLHRVSTGRGAGNVETARGTRGANRCTTGRVLGTLRGALAAERGGGDTSLEQSRRHRHRRTTGRELLQERCSVLWRALARVELRRSESDDSRNFRHRSSLDIFVGHFFAKSAVRAFANKQAS